MRKNSLLMPLDDIPLPDTQQRLPQFPSIRFDVAGATVMERLRQQHRRRRRHAELMRAAMVSAG